MAIMMLKYASAFGAAFTLFSAVSVALAEIPPAPVPLGDASLDEVRWERLLSPGLTIHTIQRGDPDHLSLWTLSAGVARNSRERELAEGCLSEAGLAHSTQSFPFPGAYAGQQYLEVIGGEFLSEAAANAAKSRVIGCNLKARAFAASPHDRSGPWRLQIAEIDPKQFKGHLFSLLGDGETLVSRKPTEMADRTGALIAFNGGFFVTNQIDGIVGAPTGISVLDDRLRSLPTEGRPYLLIYDDQKIEADIIKSPPSPLLIRWSDGTTTPLRGIDRQPGRIRNCGSGASSAAIRPRHDVTCIIENDLVAVTPMAKLDLNRPGLISVLVSSNGDLTTGRRPVGDELLLVGTGRVGALLTHKLRQRATVFIDLTYSGMTKTKRRRSFAINGGPLLIDGGRPVRRDDREGWSMSGVDIDRANFIHEWTTLRNPRTAVGIAPNGHIWILVVDGREFSEASSQGLGRSSGLSIEELRKVMSFLGVAKAINLDGGGSSALVVGGSLVTNPSDLAGERAVGDSVVLTP